jgi:hypothetical protein
MTKITRKGLGYDIRFENCTCNVNYDTKPVHTTGGTQQICKHGNYFDFIRWMGNSREIELNEKEKE